MDLCPILWSVMADFRGLKVWTFWCQFLILNDMLDGSVYVDIRVFKYIDMECVVLWKLYAFDIIAHDTCKMYGLYCPCRIHHTCDLI